MKETLVICIGNVARGDDGVTHEVARLIADTPGLRVESATSLDVTHAEIAAHASHVFVVDAERRESPLVEMQEIDLGGAPRSSHGLDPGGLLSLARGLYGGEPRLWLVSVAAPHMDHGIGLSGAAHRAARDAAEAIRQLATSG